MNKTNKIFLTGASGGIGSAICEKFISHDFTLVLTSSSTEKLDHLKKNMEIKIIITKLIYPILKIYKNP